MLSYSDWYDEIGVEKREELLLFISKTPKWFDKYIKNGLNIINLEEYVDSIVEKEYVLYLTTEIEKEEKCQ
ncbi:MAG: hypothetical protein AB7G52_08945 [Arcobacter sp.]